MGIRSAGRRGPPPVAGDHAWLPPRSVARNKGRALPGRHASDARPRPTRRHALAWRAAGGARAGEDRASASAEAVEALSEAIDIIRAIWNPAEGRGVYVDGKHYRVHGARRGPKPAHDISIWLGAYKPRMLRLTGRKADGWLPSLSYLEEGDLERGNAIIDEAATAEGRDPRDIRRLLNIQGAFGDTSSGFLQGPPEQWVEELLPLALENGVSAFLLWADDPAAIERYGAEVAPALREAVARERDR